MAQASPAQPSEPQQTSPERKANLFQKLSGMILGFLPWIAYWSLAGNVPFRLAVTVACVVGVALVAWSLLRRRAPKVLEIGSAIVFLCLLVAPFLVSGAFLQRWIQPMTNAGIFLIAFVSIVIGKPFTLQYARDETPPEVAATPAFLRVNRTITLAWVIAYALMTVSSLIPPLVYGQATVSHKGTLLSIFGYWVIPYLFLLLAIFFTFWYPGWFRRQMRREQSAASPNAPPPADGGHAR